MREPHLAEPGIREYHLLTRDTPDYEIQEKCVQFLTRRCGVEEFSAADIHRALGIFASNSCNMASSPQLYSKLY